VFDHHLTKKSTQPSNPLPMNLVDKYNTNTQEVTTHSPAPSKCIQCVVYSSDHNATWTGQAQAGKKSQANTTQHYSTHSSVGTRMPARKLAPLDLANMPTDARYAKKFPLHRPTLSAHKAPFTNEARMTPAGPYGMPPLQLW
jgi:hypothetical protein